MSDPSMPEIGDVVADKYEIVKLIGEGGMGSVFMATHTLTGKTVALKWMLPELATNEDAVQRFLREAQAAGRINHPNVVDIYDVGEHQGSPFLVMECLHGEPLTTALERGGLTAAQVIDIILPSLRGVAAAHRKGVVHRDLKPDNIFLCTTEEGIFIQPKVLDFGISKLSGNESHNPRLTRTGAVMGTPYYMSPEQIRGSHDVDGRCDVYAFGVILYEALTGHVPFNADTYSALVLEIATGTPRPPNEVNPSISNDLAAVVMKGMAREPEDRYPDVASLGMALEPFAGTARFTLERMDPTGSQQRKLSSANVTSTPFNTERAPEVPGRRSPTAMIAAGVAVALAAAAGVFFLGGGSQESGAGEGPAAASAPPTAPTLSRSADEAPSEEPAATAEPLPTGTLPTEGAAPGAASAADDAPATRNGAEEGGAGGREAATLAAAQGADGADDDADDADDETAEADDDSAAAKKRAKARRKARARQKARPTRTTQRSAVTAPPKREQAPPAKKRRGRTGNLSIEDF